MDLRASEAEIMASGRAAEIAAAIHEPDHAFAPSYANSACAMFVPPTASADCRWLPDLAPAIPTQLADASALRRYSPLVSAIFIPAIKRPSAAPKP